ncbi:MAG: hypothetical protein BAJATHORv1_40363 [Candidatus Thorarchaeota archaeon]|nr:MAG: hypothetical protein BAJATHORv1_40363 [Candidatus Thorarchaeota archaeon]
MIQDHFSEYPMDEVKGLGLYLAGYDTHDSIINPQGSLMLWDGKEAKSDLRFNEMMKSGSH